MLIKSIFVVVLLFGSSAMADDPVFADIRCNCMEWKIGSDDQMGLVVSDIYKYTQRAQLSEEYVERIKTNVIASAQTSKPGYTTRSASQYMSDPGYANHFQNSDITPLENVLKFCVELANIQGPVSCGVTITYPIDL